MKNKIYLDNAASTPTDKEVAKEMAGAVKLYGNPSSYNDCGREASEYVKRARLKVARFLGAHPDEIIFTGSGTEANNLAIFGTTSSRVPEKGEIISTPIEHQSVLKPLEYLSQKGWEVRFVKVDKSGLIAPDDLKRKLSSRTVLVSVMYANNEIGTVQPITKISKIIRDFRSRELKAREKAPLFHVDACQATEYLNMNVNNLGVDLLTFNGSKIYGPKGVGVLYRRRGVKLSPLLMGGEQESGLRAGTENLPVVGGLAVALDGIDKKERERLSALGGYFMIGILKTIPDAKINGPVDNRLRKSVIHRRLPNNVSISVPSLTSETLLLELDKYGIFAGSGSACTSHAVEPSHVLKAIGLDKKYLGGALRFSMGRYTAKKDIDYVLKVLPKIVKDLRERYKSTK